MFRKKSLAFKLSFYILSSVLFIVLLLLFYNYEVSKKLILKDAEDKAFSLAQSTKLNIENILLSAQKIPENLAYIYENSSFNAAELNGILKMAVESNEEIFGSCVAFEPNSFFKDSVYYAPYYYKTKGSVKLKYLGNKDYNYFDLSWYKLPKQQGALWSEPYFDEGGGNIIMSTYSFPIYEQQNGHEVFKGVVTADVSLEWLDSLMNNLHIYKTGYAFLISRKGTILTHPETSLRLGQTIFSVAEKYHKPELENIGKEMIAGKTNFIKYKSLLTGGDCHLYYAPISLNNWSIGLVFPEKELFADLNDLATWLLILGGLGIVILFFLIIIIAKTITHPIRNLAEATQKIGSGDFNVKLPEVRSKDELAQLTMSFNAMQQHLNKYIANLKETTAAKEKIESELKIAHDIQQSIIPKIFPPPPQRNDVDIYAVLQPAKEVGGDLYDFFYTDDNVLAFAVGDVSGKGVPASLFMAITVTLLRAKANKNMKVNEIVQQINVELCRDNVNSMFVTFFMGLINLKTGELNYCNAGHNYPYIIKPGNKLQCLEQTHGTPLGLFEKTKYKSNSVYLQRNDKIVLFTDGITEAMNKNNNLFTDERFEQTLADLSSELSVKEVVDNLLKEIDDFTVGAQQSDDITLLTLACLSSTKNHSKTSNKKIVIKNDIAELERINAFLTTLSDEWNLKKEIIFDFQVVLEEIVSNIIFYAFDDNKIHEIEILIKIGDELSTEIIDDGKEFNPLEEQPPEDLNKKIKQREEGGLGIHFVKTLMDSVEYNRKEDRNIIILKKKITNT